MVITLVIFLVFIVQLVAHLKKTRQVLLVFRLFSNAGKTVEFIQSDVDFKYLIHL